ncbi:phosphate acyltransferase PlsX [bacterium]|nr:phosphate acyltransferase PlsX [bacterium]
MIAIDAMGGDRAPRASVLGALSAARRGIVVTLYGDKSRIVFLLNSSCRSWHTFPISIVHCSDTIAMHEEPAKAVVSKKESSLVRAVQAVADGKADAIVSAGNSGAMLFAGTVILGRVKGLKRPALGQFIPTKKGSIFCLDLGANVDCKAIYLQQFAYIGSVYVRLIKNIDQPRVALLANGSESSKGSLLTKEAYRLLQDTPDITFVGNIEPSSLFDDQADVLVCDGFSGNIMLKTIEGSIEFFLHSVDTACRRSFFTKCLSFLLSPFFLKIRKNLQYKKKGGALLLGVNKPMVIAHGISDEHAMCSVIEFAHSVVKKNIVSDFNKQLAVRLEKTSNRVVRVARKVRSLLRSSGL